MPHSGWASATFAETVISPSIESEQLVPSDLDTSVPLEVVHRIGTELSFLTTGQEVPDHIETARPDRLAELVIGEAVLQ